MLQTACLRGMILSLQTPSHAPGNTINPRPRLEAPLRQHLPPRSPRLHRHPPRRRLLAQALRLRRPGLPRRRRLHGPGQLGHRPRRRRPLRLHPAQRRHAHQPHGDPAPGPRRTPRHRQRPRPRPGLPRPLLAPASPSPSGSSARLAIAACDLAEVIGSAIALNLLFGLPHDLGRLPHRPRRPRRPLPAEPRLPLRRSPRRRPHHRHRRIVRHRAVPREARLRRRRRRLHPAAPAS